MRTRRLIGVFACCVCCTQAATFTVSNASQLVSTVGSASSGDTILLNDGTYTLASSPLTIATSLTIRSVNGASKVTITGPSGTYTLVQVAASNTTLDGLTLTGATGFGVSVNNSNTTLTNVILRNLAVSAAGSATAQAISFGTVTNSVIELCTVTLAGFHAIAIANSNWNLLINNTVQQTQAGNSGIGIALQSSDHNTISGNTISNTDGDGVLLQGSQYNYVSFNSITAPHNGVTLSNQPSPARNSIRNYVGNNLMTLSNKSGSDGIWINNDSDWNLAALNDASGANENGLALFNSIGNYLRGNLFHQNPQGGIFILTNAGTTPVNNSIQRNYLYNHGSNGGVTTNHAGATDVGFNFIAGNPSQIQTPIAGFLVEGTANTKLYANVVQNLEQGENIDANTTNTSLYLNRYLNVSSHYTFQGAGVQWDSGSPVLGGNFFSDFTSANGNPSNGSTPYTNIIDNTSGTGSPTGVYKDRYPYQSESLGKPYKVAVLTPPAGVSVAAGSQKTISWNSQSCVMVDINLLSASNSSTAIASNYADFGYYRWTVPGVTPGTYSIQVSCKNSSGTATGVSATGPQFNITTGDLVLLSPESDLMVDPGQSTLISWKKSGNVTQPVTVNIRYSDSGTYTLLQTVTTNDFVTVPLTGATSNRVSVKVASGSFADSTDGWLTTRNGNGQFTSPGSAAALSVGTPYSLEWISPPGSDYVNIDLLIGSNTTNIATGLGDFGKYVMLVPAAQSSSGTLRLTFYNSAGHSIGTATSASLSLQSNPCDVNADGTTNVADVQDIINEALGVASPANDLNGDGKVNVADVQIVINAALGQSCN